MDSMRKRRNSTVCCGIEQTPDLCNPTEHVGILQSTEILLVPRFCLFGKYNSMKYILNRTALKRLFGTF